MINSISFPREALEKLHMAIKDGRSSKVTRKNKALLGAEESHAQLSYDIKHAESNVRINSFIVLLFTITS